jgi:hypothetical protein
MNAKAAKIKQLKGARRVATLLSTGGLEGSSVDDALLLFDLLMATKLLAGAARAGNREKLRNLPKLQVAAVRMAAAWKVALGTRQEVGDKAATMPEVMSAVDQVVSREKLAAAVETVFALLPAAAEADAEDDNDLEWRAELAGRYATVRPFIELLASVVPWGCTAAGTQIVAALRALPKLMARKKPGAEHVKEFDELIAGSWRRLVFANPRLEPPLIDRPAYTFCVLEALHSARPSGCSSARLNSSPSPSLRSIRATSRPAMHWPATSRLSGALATCLRRVSRSSEQPKLAHLGRTCHCAPGARRGGVFPATEQVLVMPMQASRA